MKLHAHPSHPASRKHVEGSALIVTVVIAGLIGFSLQSYLTLVSSQNRSVTRAMSWNAAVPILEAGLEEALSHINANTNTADWATQGWTNSGSTYTKSRTIGDGYYSVIISNTISPTIYSTGFARLPLSTDGYVSRTAMVTTSRDGMFMKAMVAKGTINMNGNNIRTDSFDSANTAYSSGGQYDPTKAKDNGDVATNSGLANSLNVGNANIFGRVGTGPGGSISIGSNGAVGSRAWQNAGNTGIQAGWSANDMNVAFPDVGTPFSGGYSTPTSGTVDGNNYTYVLNSGNYQLNSLSMSGQNKLIVTGNAVLYVTGNLSMSGQSQIILKDNASLKLYVAGSSASIGGNGVMNPSGNASKFSYWGMPSNTSLAYSGNAAFIGTVYAPNASFSLSGGGNNGLDFVGSSVTATVLFNGHFSFHYDELLGRTGPSRGFIVTSWNEI